MKISITKHVLAMALTCMLMGNSLLSFADVAIIVHPSNNAALSKKDVQRIFLGKLKEFPGGGMAIPIDLPQKSEVRGELNALVINKDMRQIKSYWSRLIFTGKGLPPKQVSTIEEAKKIVARNPDAIAYISEAFLDETVKRIVFN